MKTSHIYRSVILLIVASQMMYAQYAEDALRFSQLGTSVGARSQSMGNTVVGLADDYSALFGNPAGLSQQKSSEFFIGLSNYNYGNEVSFLGNKTTDNSSVTNLNNLGVVYPIATVRGGLTFAFGFGRMANYTSIASFEGFNQASSIVRSFYPFSYSGGKSDTLDIYGMSSSEKSSLIDNNIPFQVFLADTANDYLFTILRDRVRQTVQVLEGGGLNHWSLGGGIDVAPNLSLGISLNFISGSYSYDRDFTESDPGNVHNTFPDDFNSWTYTSGIRSDITGFNALFGLMYREPGKFRIGGTLRTSTIYNISETFTDEAVSNFDGGSSYSYSSGGETEYKIKTPLVFSLGLSVQALKWLLIAGDAEYTDWTQMEFDSDNPDLIQENNYIKRWMRETWNLRGGAEVALFNIGLKLRAGIEYKPSPWKNDPSDFDQWNYTAGIGYALDQDNSINGSFALGSWKTFRDNYSWGNTPASRTSEIVSTRMINVSFSHKF